MKDAAKKYVSKRIIMNNDQERLTSWSDEPGGFLLYQFGNMMP